MAKRPGVVAPRWYRRHDAQYEGVRVAGVKFALRGDVVDALERGGVEEVSGDGGVGKDGKGR